MDEETNRRIDFIASDSAKDASDDPSPGAKKEKARTDAEQKRTPSEQVQHMDARDFKRNIRRIEYFEDELQTKERQLDEVVTSRERLHCELIDAVRGAGTAIETISRLTERLRWEAGGSALVAALAGLGGVLVSNGDKNVLGSGYFFGIAFTTISVVVASLLAARGFLGK